MRKYLLVGLFMAVTLPCRALEIVTTIKPLGFIAAAITDGLHQPKVLLPIGASPHDFALRPSDIRHINSADLVIWVGPELEGFMAKPLSRHPHVLTLTHVEHLPLFYYGSEQQGTEQHKHDHDHDHHHGDHHDHKHSHTGIDPHIWLGPPQAKAIAQAIAAQLSELDPANSQRYQANLATFISNITEKDRLIAAQMKQLTHHGYFVFHDAYGYWERHYGMKSQGHFTVNPERQPGAKKLAEIRQALAEKKAHCIYAEPQFSPKIIAAIAQHSGAKILQLDEIGEHIQVGPDAYFDFMQQLADSFMGCAAASPN